MKTKNFESLSAAEMQSIDGGSISICRIPLYMDLPGWAELQRKIWESTISLRLLFQ